MIARRAHGEGGGWETQRHNACAPKGAFPCVHVGGGSCLMMMPGRMANSRIWSGGAPRGPRSRGPLAHGSHPVLETQN